MKTLSWTGWGVRLAHVPMWLCCAMFLGCAGCLSCVGCGDDLPITPDPEARARLVARVTEMGAATGDDQARRDAVEALFAAGSEQTALELLQKVDERKAALLIRLARYTTLRERENESLEFVSQAVALAAEREDAAKAIDALVVEAAKMAAETRSAAVLGYLRRLGRERELSAAALSQIVISTCDIAVENAAWHLLEEVSPLASALPLEDEARDSAYSALAWATAHRISSTGDKSHVERAVEFARAIPNQPRQAMAFAFLAEAGRKIGDQELMERMVEGMDSAMTGSSGYDVVEGFCRIARAFRLNREFGEGLLERALEYARRSSSIFDLPVGKDGKSANGTFGAFTAKYYCWIARVALEVDAHRVALPAFKAATDVIAGVDPEMSLLLGVTFSPYLEAIEEMDDAEAQTAGLVTVRKFANRMPEPFSRSMLLVSISDTASNIALTRKDPAFRDVAWQSIVLIPMAGWQKDQIAKLAYTSARLGGTQYVTERLPGLLPAEDPVLELRVAAATLKGLAESEGVLVPRESRFLEENSLTLP